MVKRYYNLLYTNMACHRKRITSDAAVQTVIRVYPHILNSQNARISSEKKMQTELSIKPDQRSEKFYSLLRYTPYQDIQENCIRIIDLPRQVRLQFTGVEYDRMAQASRIFSLADDDGVGYICSELIQRMCKKQKPTFQDVETQTDLNVYPHLLKADRVATLKKNTEVQTNPES